MQATAPRGFSADTEILTRSGWVTFDRLTYLDEIAARSPDGRFEWRPPERITWQRYDGEMIWFHGRATDILVTPDHRMPWMPDSRSDPRITTASEIFYRPTRPARARAAGLEDDIARGS